MSKALREMSLEELLAEREAWRALADRSKSLNVGMALDRRLGEIDLWILRREAEHDKHPAQKGKS